MNRIRYRSVVILLAGLLPLLPAVQAEEARTTASMTFHGTSTLHEFEGTVATAPFTARFSETKDGKTLVSATTSLKVRDMNTQNKKRDKNMFKMFDAKNHALIAGSVENAVLPKEGKSETKLKLKIRNVEKEISATLSDWKREGSKISCRITFPVSLKEFGLKAPSVMGLIRVGDTVNVECTLEGTIL